MRVGSGVKRHRHEPGVLKRHVHLEHVISRCHGHLFFVREDHGLKHINHLRNIGSTNAIGMARKNVHVERGQNSITQAVLLEQKSRVAAGQRCIPTAPFINHKGYLFFRIIFVHDGRMLGDQTVHLESGFKTLRILILPKALRR